MCVPLRPAPSSWRRSERARESIRDCHRADRGTRRSGCVLQAPRDHVCVRCACRRYVAEAEPYYRGFARGAMRDGDCIAAYLLEDRVMRVGAARLRAACVVAVVTEAAYRHRGIGAAMMRDAASWAAEHSYALLFLHGCPNFYDQFGY